ncbi:beta-N-acetylhexosaminidase [Gemmatimonas sp.]|uniref:beta-N-acetylhexosaminidase n=1 Tax=Gemmatimonas sp. TaxID=1962908 RepID=UPI00286CCB8A|nr:beta-N-acetylhexosaminidase [Gemmatimonas sp.]
MRHLILAALVALPATGAATARAMPADSSTYAIIPRPVVLTPKSGAFTITARTVVHADPAFTGVARRFARDVANPTGFDLTVVRRATASSAASGGIALVRTPALGPEAYTLDVMPSGVVIKASDPAGAFYGLETLKQLLPAAIYREAPLGNTVWRAAAVHVEDAPRFTWRGSHLDVARHFESKEFVKKYIDLLARHKMNRFHWHLTEDQGWRIEIKKYPLLTELGSCREQTLVGPYIANPKPSNFDGKRHCGFYTQDDVREVVAYAADRMITVVPEIEMPGHAQAAIHAYPRLSSRPDSSPGVLQVWGVSDFILNPTDSTVAFMQDVLTEVLALFPGPFIHIGGDEAGKAQWKANPEIQARIKALGLKDEHEMQSWFIRQMDTFLTARGRRMIGWDEILEGGLAENATVMSWRGMAGGIEAAKANHDVVMAPGSHTYFDHYQSRDKTKEPLAIGGFTPIDSVYAFEPVPPQLSADEAKHILGAQAQLWAEYMPNAKHVEYMAYPRMVALSEVLWSAKTRRDFANFSSRLPTHLARLDALDVNYRKQ